MVTLESPALCQCDSHVQLLLAHLEALKVLVKNGKPERLERIAHAIKDRRGEAWKTVQDILNELVSKNENKKSLKKILLGQT